MEFEFLVNVTVERTTGKFASRDEIEMQIQDALSEANPQEIEGDEGGVYEVSDFEVNAQEVTNPLARHNALRAIADVASDLERGSLPGTVFANVASKLRKSLKTLGYISQPKPLGHATTPITSEEVNG